MKSVGGTDNSKSVQFTGPNRFKMYADKLYV